FSFFPYTTLFRSALMQELANSGFYNYMGSEGMQTDNPYLIGEWDGGAWYDPKQDLAKFGYGSTNLSLSGQRDPNRTSIPDVTLGPTEQIIPVESGLSREQVLQQLAQTGQLNV